MVDEELDWEEEDVDWEEFNHDGDMLFVDERNQTRHKVRVEVDIRTPEGDYSGQLGDISRGGMFIVCEDYNPDEGANFAFRVDLPGVEQTIRGRAEVRWLKGEEAGFGAQFQAMTMDDIERIDQFVETQAALEEALLGNS